MSTPLTLSLLLTAAMMLAPSGLLAAARDLFVASGGTNNVKRFDGETGAFLGNFMPNGAAGLENTQTCLFGPDGHMYVSGFRNTDIFKFHGSTGDFLGTFSSGFSLNLPTKMTYGPDAHLYVSQWGGLEKVVKFDAFTGAYLGDATSVGVVGGMGQAWDPDGNLYVASFGLNGTDGDVFRFDSAGNPLGSFLQSGFLMGPVNLWFDTNGNLLVQDWTQGTIERFDGTTGLWLSTFVTGLARTDGWVYGSDGKLYVCDWFSNVVNRYEADGQFDQAFTLGGNLNKPNGVTFGLENPVSAPMLHTLETSWLAQNSPNPFPGSTSIRFTLSQRGPVRIVVRDVRGRRVETIMQEERNVGEHSVGWDARALANGIYFYTLETHQGNETRRMTLLR